VTAAETMHVALIELTDHEQRPPCADRSGAWTSEDHTERKWAARHCAGCPIITLCADLAGELKPRFGVWAGVDRTPRPMKPRSAQRKALA
jgi:hypothetical protein